jgi:glycosyltransferase involved in cell wall biosynthesis
MPARDVENYIGRAIESLLAQTFSDIEVIVVDDGSRDDTIAVVRAYDDPRIRIIQGPRSGIAAARAAGLAAASGEYVGWLDADDAADADRCLRQADYLDSHPRTVALGTSARAWTEEGNFAGTIRAEGRAERIEELLRTGRNVILQPTAMIRAQAAREAGGYDSRLDGVGGEDREFHCRLARLGDVRNLSEPLTDYVLRRGAISNGLTCLSRSMMRRREAALLRVCTEGPNEADLAVLRAAAERAQHLDPELAYCFRVGKQYLANDADPRVAVEYLARAWRRRPLWSRTLKNLAQALWRSVTRSRGV